MSTAMENDSITVVEFPRRNRNTGKDEAIRVQACHWNGRINSNLRIWFQGRPDGPNDDGWRPSQAGVSIREGELDAAIAALEAIRAMVHEAGRATDEAPIGFRCRPSTRRDPRQNHAPTPSAPRRDVNSVGDDDATF